MGINLNLIRQIGTKIRFIPAKTPKNLGVTNPRFWSEAGDETLVHLSGVTAKKALNKTEILSKYATEHGF